MDTTAYEFGVKCAMADTGLIPYDALLEKDARRKVTPGSLKGGKNEPAANAPAGEGTRFKALKRKLKGARNPEALAAAIGRAKFGKKKFQQMATRGR